MIELLLIVLAGLLVAACGAFVAAEFSFLTVDRGSVERAAEGGGRASRGVLSAVRTLSTQLSAAQLGYGMRHQPPSRALWPIEKRSAPSYVIAALAGVAEKDIYVDHASGAKASRPRLPGVQRRGRRSVGRVAG